MKLKRLASGAAGVGFEAAVPDAPRLELSTGEELAERAGFEPTVREAPSRNVYQLRSMRKPGAPLLRASACVKLRG
jgi:hypothetical protein